LLKTFSPQENVHGIGSGSASFRLSFDITLAAHLSPELAKTFCMTSSQGIAKPWNLKQLDRFAARF
jgi:hypothetical protein